MSHFEGTDKLRFPLYNSTRKHCDGSTGNNTLCHIVMRTAWAHKPLFQTQLNYVKNVFSPDCFSLLLKKLRFSSFSSGIFRFPPVSLACDQKTAPPEEWVNDNISSQDGAHFHSLTFSSFPKGFLACHSIRGRDTQYWSGSDTSPMTHWRGWVRKGVRVSVCVPVCVCDKERDRKRCGSSQQSLKS